MATLGPLGFLVFWLAIAAAPPGATMARVEMGEGTRYELTRDSKGRWLRTLPAEAPVLYTKDRTTLVARAAIPTGNPAEDERILPLHEWFGLTGKEDFGKPLDIPAKPLARVGRQVKVDARGDRMEVRVEGPGGPGGKAVVTWNARRPSP